MAFDVNKVKLSINTLKKGKDTLRNNLKELYALVVKDLNNYDIAKKLVEEAIDNQNSQIHIELCSSCAQKKDIYSYYAKVTVGSIVHSFTVETIENFEGDKDIAKAFKNTSNKIITILKDYGLGKNCNVVEASTTNMLADFPIDMNYLAKVKDRKDAKLAKYAFMYKMNNIDKISKNCSIISTTFENYILSEAFEDSLQKIFEDLRSSEIYLQFRVYEQFVEKESDGQQYLRGIVNIAMTDQNNSGYFDEQLNTALFANCYQINCMYDEYVDLAMPMKEEANNCLMLLYKKLNKLGLKVSGPKKFDIDFRNKYHLINISVKLK